MKRVLMLALFMGLVSLAMFGCDGDTTTTYTTSESEGIYSSYRQEATVSLDTEYTESQILDRIASACFPDDVNQYYITEKKTEPDGSIVLYYELGYQPEGDNVRFYFFYFDQYSPTLTAYGIDGRIVGQTQDGDDYYYYDDEFTDQDNYAPDIYLPLQNEDFAISEIVPTSETNYDDFGTVVGGIDANGLFVITCSWDIYFTRLVLDENGRILYWYKNNSVTITELTLQYSGFYVTYPDDLSDWVDAAAGK